MLFPVLLVFLSCKKMDNTGTANYQNNIQATIAARGDAIIVYTPQTPVTNVDITPPADAVSVKKYDAAGNGITDDSEALQNAINSETKLVLPAGTYLIDKTLNMRPGVKIYGTDGAVIKAGLLMKSTLLTHGRFFLVENDDNCSFINISFQSARAFEPGDWSNACIYVQNSRNTNISYNNFNFSLAYAKNGVNAIWISGSGSQNTLIKGNKLNSVGIEYAEDGASGTFVDGNTIDHAPSDALCAHGNSDTYCSNNVLINNVITNPGMMGIEDWGKIDGTIIKNNTVTGCGKDPAQRADGMGISAVGINSFVVNNTITDAQAYYIECGRNNTINGNIINDTNGQAVGIIANYTAADGAGPLRLLNTQIVSNNTVNGCSYGVYVFGDNITTTDITIAANTITNPSVTGINIDNNSAAYHITVSNNNISFTVPNAGPVRKGCETYTEMSNRNKNQLITFNNNTINYAASADGGNGQEKGFWIATDNTVLNANKVYGNNIKAGKAAVCGISGNTDPAKNITLTGNIVQGATTNLTDFIFNIISNNTFSR